MELLLIKGIYTEEKAAPCRTLAKKHTDRGPQKQESIYLNILPNKKIPEMIGLFFHKFQNQKLLLRNPSCQIPLSIIGDLL